MLFLSAYSFVDAPAQTMPLVYQVENTGADCPIPYLPSFNELPAIPSLPDPFEWLDGRGRMKGFSDWRLRRAEIGAQIQKYEIGQKPPRPDSVTANYSAGVLTVQVTVNGRTLTLTSQVILPAGTGPFPAVIGMNSPSGSLPDSIFKNRNIAEIAFVHNQVTTYGSPKVTDPYYRLYPNLNPDNTGQYSAWAWGVSRLIDGLELVQNVLPIDLKHIAVTGCSYAGKMALYAGAFDERIALTISQESGGGGATSWRYSHSEPVGSVEDIDNTDYNWFMNSMSQFSGDNVYRLPEDHHELMAMVAPRALLVTANPDYTWLSNPSCYVASKACKEVYKTLGIADRFGFSIVGGHMHCQIPGSQIPEIGAFVDKFLLGKDTVNTSDVADSPYSIDLSKWIPWTNPTLSNDTTYFTKPVYPADGQAGMDTSVTLKWNRVGAAQRYIIQLSTDGTFNAIDRIDSTTTDTTKTFDGLSKNGKYYWRVLVRSSAGSGPWSNVSNFVTTLILPAAPLPVPSVESSTGYVTFKWSRAESADQYLIHVSTVETFASIFKSLAAADTSATLYWFSEGKRYYWRVRSINLAGSSPWSDVFSFALIYAPTNLVSQKSAPNEVALSWDNRSSLADGYIVERTESPDTTFVVLDTLKGSVNEYADKNVEGGKTYKYRVKAFKGGVESAYSNESSLLLAVVEKGGIPTEFSLSQNYPNPFNPSTKIKFALPKSAFTRLTVFDLLGRQVETLVERELGPGYYEINFNASNLANGVYFYRINSGNFVRTMKLILLK